MCRCDLGSFALPYRSRMAWTEKCTHLRGAIVHNKTTCSSDGTSSHAQCIAQGDLGRHRFLQVSITFFVDHNTALAQGMISRLHCNLMPWFPRGQNCNCNKYFYSFLLSDSAFLVTAILYCSSPYAFPIYPLFVCLDVCVHHSRELWDLATALW